MKNKFAVVPLHFLLVTKHFESQTFPLTPPQLIAAYQVLLSFYDAKRSADSPAGELLCFYNCGEMSGASQPHKHVQVSGLFCSARADDVRPALSAMCGCSAPVRTDGR